MANFNLTITDEGAAFLADIIANSGTINFTEVRFSNTNYVGSEAGLTAGTFAGTFITATPSASVVDSTTINVASDFDNSTFTADMSLYSIGLIAEDGNSNTALVAVCTTNDPQIISKFILTASHYAYNINLSVSSTDNITVTSSLAGVVYVADIVDNLTSTYVNKPLSANQGKVLKDLIDQGTGMKPHIIITSDAGSTVTLTLGGTTVTAEETSAGTFEADVASYGTWTIDSELNGDTATTTLVVDVVKIYTVTLMHFAATITVNFPNGGTCTCAATGQPTQTATTSPHTFTVGAAATYTISVTFGGGTTATGTVVITTDGQSETVTLPIGATVTPTDDISMLLACAGIVDNAISTISDLLAASSTLSDVIDSNNAIDYLVRSTTFASDCCADSGFMNYVGLNNYAADALRTDSTWLTAIANSTYTNLVLNVYVPNMTSNNTPSGVVTRDSVYSSYEAWNAFSDNGERYLTSQKTNQYLGYEWADETPSVCCVKMTFALTPAETAPKNMHIDVYYNGAWVTIDTFTYTGSATSGSVVRTFANSYQSNKYRLYMTDAVNASAAYMGVNRLNFYGRKDV